MEKNSQSYQLKRIVKQSLIAVVVGAVLLVFSVGTNIWVGMVTDEELETTTFLNQYRLGSKTLTHAVQSYAATGEQQYYEEYMKELEEDKNRDIAWVGLKACFPSLFSVFKVPCLACLFFITVRHLWVFSISSW